MLAEAYASRDIATFARSVVHTHTMPLLVALIGKSSVHVRVTLRRNVGYYEEQMGEINVATIGIAHTAQ